MFLLQQLRDLQSRLDQASQSSDPHVLAAAVRECQEILSGAVPGPEDDLAVIISGNAIEGIALHGPVAAEALGETDSEVFDKDFSDEWHIVSLLPYDLDASPSPARLNPKP